MTIDKFLAAKGFDHYGLFVRDYGGPVGFRIVGRNPKALDWLIVQNSNAYEVGFTPAWDGFRKALWIDRSPENEKPLAGFNTPEAIKTIVYMGGAGHPGDRAGGLRERRRLGRRANQPAHPARPVLRLSPQPRAVPGLAEVPPRPAAEDADFLGPARPVLQPRRRRGVPQGSPEAEIHRLNADHFATEDNLPFIASHIIAFYDKTVKAKKRSTAK